MVGWNSEDQDDHLTQGQWYSMAFKEHASNVGIEQQDVEWILTPFDTWERNPHYTGEPGPHPEDLDSLDYEQE